MKKTRIYSIDGTRHAWCSKCREWMPVTQFNRNKARPNGLQNQCKDCLSIWRNSTTWRAYNYEQQIKYLNKHKQNVVYKIDLPEINKCYIGSSINWYQRFSLHQCGYDADTNPTLRDYRQQYNLTRDNVCILMRFDDSITESERKAVEQFYIDSFRQSGECVCNVFNAVNINEYSTQQVADIIATHCVG